jgi:hypothetical protein
MSSEFKGLKKTVDLHQPARPSRIRRDPVRTQAEQLSRNAWWTSSEWEIRLAIVGMVLFAIAINAAVIDIGEMLSH